MIRSASASVAQQQSSITGEDKDQASNSRGNSASISAHSGYTTKRSISDIREKYCQLKKQASNQRIELEWRMQDLRERENQKQIKLSLGQNFGHNTNRLKFISDNAVGSSLKSTQRNQTDDNDYSQIQEDGDSSIIQQIYLDNKNQINNNQESRQKVKQKNNLNTRNTSYTIETQDLSQTLNKTQKISLLNNDQGEIGYTEFLSVGSDQYGQLGHAGDQQTSDKIKIVCNPKSLSFDILISQISCGSSHTLLLSQNNQLFSFGSNQYGQLGLNDKFLPFSTAPLLIQPVKRISGNILRIVAGGRHNLMLVENQKNQNTQNFNNNLSYQEIYSWGSNDKGQCAQLSRQHSILLMPFKIFSQVIRNNKIKQVDCGDNFSCFLTESGQAFTWGDNSEGQLGLGCFNDQQIANFISDPQQVQIQQKINQVSLGFRHSLFLTNDQQVYASGMNQNFEIGLGFSDNSELQNFYQPILIQSLCQQGTQKVIAGTFSAAINKDNQLLIWGKGEFGLIRSPQRLYMDKVQFVDCQISKFGRNALKNEQIYSSAVAIDENGQAYSWGSNKFGQLGHGDQRDRKLPSQILSLRKRKINQISIGADFMIMLGNDIKVDTSLPSIQEIKNMQQSQPFDLQIIKQIQKKGKDLQNQFYQNQNQDRIDIQNQNYQNQIKKKQQIQNSCEFKKQKRSMQINNQNINNNEIQETAAFADSGEDQPRDINQIFNFNNDYKNNQKNFCTIQHKSKHTEPIISSQGILKNNQSHLQLKPSNLPQKVSIDSLNLPLQQKKNISNKKPQDLLKLNQNLPIKNLSQNFMNTNFSNNMNLYQITTEGDTTTSFEKNFFGNNTKNEKQIVIGTQYSEIEEEHDEEATTDLQDLYIYKLKSKQLKNQLQQVIIQNQQQTQTLNNKINEQSQINKSLQIQIEKLIKEKNEIDQNCQQQLQQANIKTSELNIEARNLQMSKLMFDTQMQLEREQMNKLCEDIKLQYQVQLDQKNQELFDLQQSNQSKLQQYDENLTQFESILKSYSGSLNDYQNIKLQNNQLSFQMKALLEHQQQFQKDFDQLMEQNSEFQKQIKELQNLNDQLNLQNQGLEKHLNSEKNQIHQLENEFEKVKQKKDQEREQNKIMSQEILDLKVKCRHLEDKEQQLLLDLQRIQEQQEQMKILHQQELGDIEQSINETAQAHQLQIEQLYVEIRQLQNQLLEAQDKNDKLSQLIQQKSMHMEDILKDIQNDCLVKEQMLEDNEKLDLIIQKLEKKNLELNQMMNDQIYQQASTFKNTVLNKLAQRGLEGHVLDDSSVPPSTAQMSTNQHSTEKFYQQKHLHLQDRHKFLSQKQDCQITNQTILHSNQYNSNISNQDLSTLEKSNCSVLKNKNYLLQNLEEERPLSNKSYPNRLQQDICQLSQQQTLSPPVISSNNNRSKEHLINKVQVSNFIKTKRNSKKLTADEVRSLENVKRLDKIIRQEQIENQYQNYYDPQLEDQLQQQFDKPLIYESQGAQIQINQDEFNTNTPHFDCNIDGSHSLSMKNIEPPYFTQNIQHSSNFGYYFQPEDKENDFNTQSNVKKQERLKNQNIIDYKTMMKSQGNIKQNREALEQSYDRIQYLMEQTNDLQRQTRQLRISYQ